MPHAMLRLNKSASSPVLPSTLHVINSDAPSRPRRRLSTNDKNYHKWAIIIAVSILLSIMCIFFGLKTQSTLGYVNQYEHVDYALRLNSLNSVSPQRTSLPLSTFSDLSHAFENSDLVALYFAASWCPMSTPVSLLLDTFYGDNDTILNHDGTRKSLSIVYISSDKTIDEFNRYVHNRNWIAVPYESPQRNLLKRHFATCAQRELLELGIDRMHDIPTIIVIDSATQGIITFNGVKDLENLREESLEHWKAIQGWIRRAKAG
jgi:hypothetical protein